MLSSRLYTCRNSVSDGAFSSSSRRSNLLCSSSALMVLNLSSTIALVFSLNSIFNLSTIVGIRSSNAFWMPASIELLTIFVKQFFWTQGHTRAFVVPFNDRCPASKL